MLNDMSWWNIPWGELRLPLTNGGLVSYIILLIMWHLGIFGIGFWLGWNWPWRTPIIPSEKKNTPL